MLHKKTQKKEFSIYEFFILHVNSFLSKSNKDECDTNIKVFMHTSEVKVKVWNVLRRWEFICCFTFFHRIISRRLNLQCLVYLFYLRDYHQNCTTHRYFWHKQYNDPHLVHQNDCWSHKVSKSGQPSYHIPMKVFISPFLLVWDVCKLILQFTHGN